MAKSDTTCSDFQAIVQENLVRHYSILDLVSKFQESNARVNRAIFRAVTDCGCIEIRSQADTPERLLLYRYQTVLEIPRRRESV
jgi:hypothetical protein